MTVFTKVMLIVAKSHFPWSKSSNMIPLDTRVRGGRRIYKPLKRPEILLFSIGVLHKLDSGTELKVSTKKQEMKADWDSN